MTANETAAKAKIKRIRIREATLNRIGAGLMPSSQGKRNRLRGERSRIERALILRILDYAPSTGNAFPYISVQLSSRLGGLQTSRLAVLLATGEPLAWGKARYASGARPLREVPGAAPI